MAADKQVDYVAAIENWWRSDVGTAGTAGPLAGGRSSRGVHQVWRPRSEARIRSQVRGPRRTSCPRTRSEVAGPRSSMYHARDRSSHVRRAREHLSSAHPPCVMPREESVGNRCPRSEVQGLRSEAQTRSEVRGPRRGPGPRSEVRDPKFPPPPMLRHTCGGGGSQLHRPPPSTVLCCSGASIRASTCTPLLRSVLGSPPLRM